MKTKFRAFFAAALMLIGVSAYAQTTVQICDEREAVTVNEFALNDENVDVNYQIKFIPNVVFTCDCKSTEAIVATPAIVNTKTGDKVILEVIILNGPTCNQTNDWLMERCEAVTENVRVFSSVPDRSFTVKSEYSVPFEEWMYEDTWLVVTTQKMKYPACLTRLCQDKVVPLTMDITPAWADVATTKAFDPDKELATKIYFPVNVTKQVDSYLENAQALKILNAVDDPNFEVTAIKIGGWASPEATVPYNQNLSVKRANTLKGILTKQYSFPESVYEVSGNGEYWDLVYDYVDNANDAKLDEWSASTQAMDLDKKEAELKKVNNGSSYRDIFKTVYPRSRFADCIVRYTLKEFQPEACRALYEEVPEQLSADEYIYLAQAGDKVDQKVLADGLKYYPENPYLNAIAANQAKEAGDYAKALEYYKKAGDSKEAYNNQACCLMLLGEKSAAKKALDKAKGLEQYDYNKKQIKRLK